MNEISDIEILRMVLIRELETINAYLALSRQAHDPAVRELIEHISHDEEEHVAECIQWITRLNPTLARFLTRSPDHVRNDPRGPVNDALSSDLMVSSIEPNTPTNASPNPTNLALSALLGTSVLLSGGEQFTVGGLTKRAGTE